MSKRKAPSRSGSKIEGDKPPILIVSSHGIICNSVYSRCIYSGRERVVSLVIYAHLSYFSQTLIPQCSGKAQFLKCLMNDGFEEIGPESVPQSFEKVPIGTVLSQLGHSSSTFCTSEISSASESYTDRNIYGTPVFSRIASLKDTQQGLLTQLFTSCSSFSEIEVALGASVHETHRDIFIKSVKNIFAVSPVMVSYFKRTYAIIHYGAQHIFIFHVIQ